MFIDSSAFYAAGDRGDRSNQQAKKVLSTGEEFVTTDHVLIETWLLFRSRLGRNAAEQFWQALRDGVAQVEPVELIDLDLAWHIGETFNDQDFSIVDRTSFAVMQRLGITRAATFDDDFAVYRYGPKRDRAFEVIR